MVLTSMTIKTPLRRFTRCRMFDSTGGRSYFEWIDDSLCDKVRSMVVYLIRSNETLLEEYHHFQRMQEETAWDKDVVKRVREKNSRLKIENTRLKKQLLDYQMRDMKVLWGLLLSFTVIIVATVKL